MNYKGINYKLLLRYRKKLNNDKQDLLCKCYGEYFGGSKFTKSDQKRFNIIQNKINQIGKWVY